MKEANFTNNQEPEPPDHITIRGAILMVVRVPIHLASVEEEGQTVASTDHPASCQSSWLRLLCNE